MHKISAYQKFLTKSHIFTKLRPKSGFKKSEYEATKEQLINFIAGDLPSHSIYQKCARKIDNLTSAQVQFEMLWTIHSSGSEIFVNSKHPTKRDYQIANELFNEFLDGYETWLEEILSDMQKLLPSLFTIHSKHSDCSAMFIKDELNNTIHYIPNYFDYRFYYE